MLTQTIVKTPQILIIGRQNGAFMKKNYILLFTLLAMMLSMVGCTAQSTENNETQTYQTITGAQAKEMIDADDTVIILDVRSQEEYDTGHIEGALLIPDTQITEDAEALLTDKDATILVYCRSGRRSALAAADLAELGYTGIYDFGGIIDWEYEVVVE